MTRKSVKSRRRRVKVAVRTRPTSNKAPKSSTPSVKQLANQVSSMVLAKVNPQLQSNGQNTFLGNLGMMAGNGISKIFGLGAYKMKANSLYDSSTGSQVPFMHSTNESVVFRHREYLGDVSSSILFQSNPFAVNPGLQATFPYLSTIASAFQEYRFRGMVVEYKSTSSTVVTGANTAMGTVSLVAQYRSDAPALTSKVAVLNEMWSAEGRPSDTFIMPIECDPKENPMRIQYVRTGALPAGADIKTFDLCKFSCVTQGQQTAGTVIGELWISYEVELYKPILASGANDLNIGSYSCVLSGVANATPLGTSGLTPVYDTIGIGKSATVISFPSGASGTYFVSWSVNNSSVAVVMPVVSATNGTITSANSTPNNGATSDELSWTGIISITSDSIDDVATITFGTAGTIPVSAGTLRIFEIASNAF